MASDDVCEHQNAHYLRMMSERDDLRAEMADLRDALVSTLSAAADRIEAEKRKRDEAQRQVADLRAGIESVQKAIENNRGIDRAWDALNALLSGSGEQPGERDATPDEAHDIGYAKGHTDGYREALAEHPAPVAPDVVRELDAVMHHHADRADASEAEVERLREGVFAAATVLNREFYRRPAAWVGRLAADLRALLAGPGERPGEPVGTLRVSGWPDGKTAEVRLRSAPAVPDSADVRDITDQVRYAWCWYGGATREESDQRAAQFDTWLASLAVVGQGMTAEPVAVVERVHEDQPVITARVYAPESWEHLGLGTRLYAAVRPSGQGGEDRG